MQPADGQQPIYVPDGALVECPLVHKRLRKVRTCLSCDHYKGLRDRFPGDTRLTFGKRFMVVCGYPTGRQVFETEELVDEVNAEATDAGTK